MTRARSAVAIALALVVSSACSTERRTDPPPTAAPPIESDINKLPLAVLPDLSQMDQAVRQQIGASYQSLSSSTDNRATPPADLGRAYGETLGATIDNPASTWPDGDFAKPAVVVTWHLDNRAIGS